MSITQQDYITGILGLMAQKNFLPTDMNPTERKNLETNLGFSAGQLMNQYELDRKEAEAQAQDDKRRKDFEKQTENLAKALPNITKGTLAAITAFQKDDPISGSAAVMDICSSLAPLLGGLAAAGGPPGMLVGAIFAMIGQILSFFAPKSESLTSQIENLLRKLQAEEKAQEIKAAHTKITNYASTLKIATGNLAQAQDQPDLQIDIITRIIKDFNPIEGTTITSFWEVTEWLQEENNQNQEHWPTILAAVCHAYTDLLVTVISLLSLISTDAMSKQFDKAQTLAEAKKHDAQHSLNKLRALAIARLIEYGACTNTQLNYLRRIVPAAQNRGMFWTIDTTSKNHLYGGSNIRKGDFEYLGGEQKRMTVAVSRKDIGSSAPIYHILALESWIDKGYSGYDRTYHGVSKSPYKNVNWKELNCEKSSLHALSDIWATPENEANKNGLNFYATKEKEIFEYVLKESSNVVFKCSRSLKSKAQSVRVVFNPKSFADDRDENAQNSVLKVINGFIYGGLESLSEIYVDATGAKGYVSSPWESYSGIGVDQHYLWVFRLDGFACATHASVMRCLKGEIQKPRWMVHTPNQLLYTEAYQRDQSKVDERTPLKGLVDLCPCDDGTLVAALYTRSVNHSRYTPPRSMYPIDTYSFVDDNALYTAVHHIDLKNETLSVDWTRIGKAQGLRVQKLPVFCWSLLESLTATLNKLAPVLNNINNPS